MQHKAVSSYAQPEVCPPKQKVFQEAILSLAAVLLLDVESLAGTDTSDVLGKDQWKKSGSERETVTERIL